MSTPSQPQHPTSLTDFWRKHPKMLILPLSYWAALLLLTWAFGEAFEAAGMQPWGLGAVEYTATEVLLSYAYHGYVCAHLEELEPLKIQQGQPYKTACAGLAVRSTAVLLTELAYTALPMAPGLGCSSVNDCGLFLLLLVLLRVFQDAWFFTVHYMVHRYPCVYALVHKLHHTVRAPNCFGAYFVTYYSHFLVEQLPMTVAALAFRFPKDVLVFYLYIGAFGFFMDHGGIHMGEVELPLCGLKLRQVLSLLNPEGVIFRGVEARMHDFHHERVNYNYALHYTYLDRLFGVFCDGREAPPQPRTA